jgi:sugar phosphate isomerase/epimerase
LELQRDGEGRWLVREVRAAAHAARPHGATRAFFAMHTGTGSAPLEQQAAMVRELGFDGMECPVDRTAETRRACEAAGIDLRAAYAVLDLPAIPAIESNPLRVLGPRLEPLRRAMRELAGGPGMLWLALRHEQAPLRDTAGDLEASVALRSLLEESRITGVEIALYPHQGFWLETTEHALRLADAIDDPRLGLCFNLCHHLATTDDADVRGALGRTGRRLLAATVNGAETDGTGWEELIQPLGKGTHSLRQFLDGLDAVGFRGPVGLQAFGIMLPPREHLSASMAAWRTAHAR